MTEQDVKLATEVVDKLQSHFIVYFTRLRDIQLRDLENNVLHSFKTWEDAAKFAGILETDEEEE